MGNAFGLNDSHKLNHLHFKVTYVIFYKQIVANDYKREEFTMNGFAINTEVKWNWGSGTGKGKVISRFTEDVTKTIKGAEVKRKASEKEPAYLIEQDDNDNVLKSHSELEKC